MKRLVLFLAICCTPVLGRAQTNSAPGQSVDAGYFVTRDRVEYINKLVAFPAGILLLDDVSTIVAKLEKYLRGYKPDPSYPDDRYALESNLQAMISVKEGGYGIGAVLIDSTGTIIASGHNEQVQKHRSDLHGEMALLTRFEESPESEDYLNLYVYPRGMMVFSSAEPCPMCFIRLASAGLDTKYSTPGPDDGMVGRVNCLPAYWRDLALARTFAAGNCSPEMQKLSHLLFFSYLLDNRGPK